MAAVKLIIYGHESDPTTPEATSGNKFEAKINPENITHKRALVFNTNNTANSTATDVRQYQGMSQDELEFHLVFEKENIASTQSSGEVNTNSEKGSNNKTVEVQVKELQDIVYKYQGSIHKPYYLTVNYAQFALKCHLKSMSVEYNLFTSQGEAVRAEVYLSFVGHENFEAAARNANNQSPDMTHVKTVLDGDHLPLMCQSVYDNMTHYIQIAELNNLTNFRQLKMGDPLVFPPIDK